MSHRGSQSGRLRNRGRLRVPLGSLLAMGVCMVAQALFKKLEDEGSARGGVVFASEFVRDHNIALPPKLGLAMKVVLDATDE